MNLIPTDEPLVVRPVSRRKAKFRGVDARNAHHAGTSSDLAVAPGGAVVGPQVRLLDLGCDNGVGHQPKIIAHVEDYGTPPQRRLLLTGTADVTLVFLPSGPFGYFVNAHTASTLQAEARAGDFVWLRAGLIVPCSTDRSATHHIDPNKIVTLIELRRPDGRRRHIEDVARVVYDEVEKEPLT